MTKYGVLMGSQIVVHCMVVQINFGVFKGFEYRCGP